MATRVIAGTGSGGAFSADASAESASAPSSVTITLVDLAGAEQFGADGVEAKTEGREIQESLLALSKVSSKW